MKKALIFLFTTLIAVILVGYFAINSIATSVIKKQVSAITQSKVEIEDFDLDIFNGKLLIKGFVIENLKGYKSPNLLSLGTLSVSLDPKTVFENTIIVKEVLIDKVSIALETNKKGQSNIEIVEKNAKIAENEAGEKQEVAEISDDSKPAKKVIIEKLVFSNSEIITNLGPELITIPLPNLTLKDIGKNDSKDFKESLIDAFKQLSGSSANTFKAIVPKKETFEEIGNSIKQEGENLKKGLQGLFGN
ncbi:MAG: AsmA family protein [Alphaproteobacteria bacterium ADurb.Bin438]|nr:MAG: AsmA family protein [Alphaproteobacteria bacterium ADurb.Bin438]